MSKHRIVGQCEACGALECVPEGAVSPDIVRGLVEAARAAAPWLSTNQYETYRNNNHRWHKADPKPEDEAAQNGLDLTREAAHRRLLEVLVLAESDLRRAG